MLWRFYMLFTEDTLIMCCARPEKLGYLRCTLFLFKADSVLKINLGKSEMVPMGEVANMGALADILGCKMQTLLSKYLGFPLSAQFKAIPIWDGILEWMEKRLAWCKKIYLSKGGRLTLIKSTITNLTTYCMSLFPLLVRMVTVWRIFWRDFLWGGLAGEFKFCLVNWDSWCYLFRTGVWGLDVPWFSIKPC